MDMDAQCTEPAKKTNARGAQNAPRTVATYDLGTGTTTWADQDAQANVAYDGGAGDLYGDSAWQTLLFQPTT